MSDLVERLRQANDVELSLGRDYSDLFLDAANEIERLRAALKECADGLAMYVEHEYANLDYPSQRRRYKRDIAPVIEARKLLGEKP